MKRLLGILLRYAWTPLLILAALLTPQLSATITLLVAAVANAVLIARQKRGANHLQRHLLLILAATELIIFVATLLSNTDNALARNYATLAIVALAPLGLEAEVAVVRHHTAETVKTALYYATEDAYTLLAVLAFSFIATLVWQIPPALSVVQILVITCVARPLLSGRALQATLHKDSHRWRIIFASLTVYLSYLFFFIRHYFSPAHLDVSNPLTWRATAVAMATFIACQTAVEFLNPQAPKNISRKVLLITLVVVAIVYLPLTQNYFMVRNVSAVDWVCVMVGGLFYMALYLLQLQSSQHSRRTVIGLHKQR